MAETARKIQFVGSAETNPETKPFFDGASAGKLMVRRCTSCKKVHHYPRELCPFCFGACAWEQASGKGTIYTFSVMERANPPYAIGYVTLAEGPKVLTNFVECDFKALKIGQPVKVAFAKTEGDGPSMPVFTPA
ncbi:Zn-ribbon domain-containing OB-fold protein [Rhodopila sp.]|uniref:Zn-ribbon domain-containing OB-fold protein n=1 Tax=Rhodopila sp. TaxID=2480087 RepID=UPI003D1266C1